MAQSVEIYVPDKLKWVVTVGALGRMAISCHCGVGCELDCQGMVILDQGIGP